MKSAHPLRQRLVYLLENEPQNVEEIALIASIEDGTK
jgi:hypothetical protein